jgi:hypothetical protein
VAAQVLAYLENGMTRVPGVRIGVEPPLEWVSPGIIRPGDVPAARGRALLWASEHRSFPRVSVSQGGRVIARRRLSWPASPGRVFRIPWDLFRSVRSDAGDVTVAVS